MDIFQKSITPDKPRVLAEEQIYVYVPMATSTNAGIASYNRDQFDIIGSEVSLKWPAESFTQGPIETPSIVKVLDNEFEYTGNLVDLISGNSKISSDKLEVQLKRILRDAYERPELVMLDPNYFVRTIVEKDGKQYYKYNTTAVHYNMSQNLSEDEQAQARQNISASSISDNEATNKRIDTLLQTGVYSINGKTGNVVLKNSDLENDTNYATEQYVQENGGKIDKIVLNNNEQEIINKIVTLTIDKTTVGLSNVDNTSDANKPVSIAQANAINQVQSNLDEHLSNYENPHNVTKAQIGLSNVDNTSDKNKPISDATKQALNTKMDKSGGIFTGNVGVQGNLSVSGTTITKDTETLKVQDNVIVTNANKIELLDLSGLAINKNDTQTYGIMYDAVDDSIKLGLGSIGSDDKFTFNEGEGSPVATRSDSSLLTDNHLLKWDATNNKLVDSGYSAEDKLDKISKSSTHQRAYIVDTDGSQNSIAVSITSTAPNESLIKRDKWGCAEVDTPGYSDIGKRIVNQEYVKTHFYTRADDLKPQYIYTDTIYNWHHDQTDKTKDAYSKIDFTPYSTEILTTTKDDEIARIKLGADPRTTPTVNESQAHVDISIGKPNDYSTGITLSNNYQEILGDGITIYTYQNELTDARILTLSANGLFISEGLELNTETQTAQLKNKKEISPNVIRYDIEQTLTVEQKAQARANIDASSISDNDAINNRIDAYELQVDANTAARHTHSNKSVLDGTTASYTTEEKVKLNGIANGAEVNVQADWKQTDSSSKDYIKNKPIIPDGIKLYSSTGENTDGAMTQKAVTDEFKNNLSIQFAESERQKSKNIVDINDFVPGDIVSNGKQYVNSDIYFRTNSFIPVSSNFKYTLNYHGANKLLIVGVKTYTTTDMSTGSHYLNISTFPGTFVIPNNINYIKLVIQPQNVGSLNDIDIQLESGEVATDYQPYNGSIVHDKQLTEQLSNYLPLSGGMMTGRLKLGNGVAISDANDITILTHYTDGKNYFGHENYESVIRGSKITITNPITISNKSFNYSAIEQGSANADRNVWFSDNTAIGKPVYNNNFKYNPSTNILKVGSLSLTSVPKVNDVNVALVSDIPDVSSYVTKDSSNIINNVDGMRGRLFGNDTRSVNGAPSTYQSQSLSMSMGIEFKSASTISAPNSNSDYVILQTITPWGDTSGGLPSQLSYGDGLAYRTASSSSAWNPWRSIIDSTNLLNKVYPVGSIYMSTKNNSPASFLGGTWLQLKDTFLLAHGDTYTSTKSATDSQVTSEGGEATHTLTIAEMPSHNHKTTLNYSGSSGPAGVYGSRNKDARTYTSTSVGGSSAHNNMPPYLVVYMWKRTA